MEAIEESFINDRSILEATVIERQAHSGRIHFKTKLPSGREIESNWIQESDKAKAGMQWIEAVRGQIVADSQEAAAQSRRQLKEFKAAQPVAPQFVGPDGQALASSGLSTPAAPPLPSQTPAMSASAPTTADPTAYVRSQHAVARARLDALTAEKQRIAFDYAQAQKAEAQWFGLLQAMGMGESVLEQVSNSHGVSLGSSGSNTGGSVTVSSNPSDAAADTDGADDGTDISEHDAAEFV